MQHQSTWLLGRQWGQMVSHLYYETILGPDQTVVTWFIWPLQSLYMSRHIPGQPALSQLPSRCLFLGLPQGAELHSSCVYPSPASPSSLPRVRSLSAGQLTANLPLVNVSVWWRAPFSSMMSGYTDVPNSRRRHAWNIQTNQVLPTLSVFYIRCQSKQFKVYKSNSH